jgi:hypothetical protein
MDWAERNPPPQHLYWIDPEKLGKLFTSIDDIEEIVTELESPATGSPVSKLRTNERSSILDGIRDALCAFFDSIRVNDAALYQRLAREIVQPGDVTVSFNYDVSLDRELKRAGKWQVGEGYGFPLGINRMPPSDTKLLKLHGSTNWMDSLFEGLQGNKFQQGSEDSLGSRPVLLPQEFEFLEYPPEVRDPKFKGGGMTRGTAV